MNKISFLLLTILFIACDRHEAPPPQNNPSGKFNIDVLGSASPSTTSGGMPTLWTADGMTNTTFIPLNHPKINLYGVHELQSAGGRNLVYFGTEIIEGVSRIVLFTYEGKKILSKEANLYLMPDRYENLYAHHRDAQGNLYLLTTSQTNNYRYISYAYKVDNLLGIERVEMPTDIYFAVFPTLSGLISLKTTNLASMLTLTIGHQHLGHQELMINLAAYKLIQVRSAYQNLLGKVILLISATDKQTEKPIHFMFNIDVEKKTVMRHILKLEERHYQFGKGMIEDNILLLPGCERNTNKAFYLRIDTQTDLQEVEVTKTDLEIDPKHPTAEALFIQKLDGSVYVGGTQFGKACYWKDGKLVMLKVEEGIVRSYPIEIMGYRN